MALNLFVLLMWRIVLCRFEVNDTKRLQLLVVTASRSVVLRPLGRAVKKQKADSTVVSPMKESTHVNKHSVG